MNDIPAFIYGYMDGMLQIQLSEQLEVCNAWLPEAEESFEQALIDYGAL